MNFLQQGIASALALQKNRDAQRSRVQPLGQAIMGDEPVLDDPAYLANNPTLAAILNDTTAVPTDVSQVLQNPMKALAPLLSVLPASPVATGVNMLVGEALQGFPAKVQQQAPVTASVAQADPMTNDVGGIASALMGNAAPQAEPAATGFQALLNNPAAMELLLQTGLGLASGQEFGPALDRGIQAQRAVQQQMAEAPLKAEDRKAAQRREAVELRKLEAEIKKLEADATKSASELRGDKKTMTDTEYATGLGKIYETLSQDLIYANRYESGQEFLDPESKARYVWNSSVEPAERKYLPLKPEYVDKIKALSGQVDAGQVPKSQLYSRLDEYVLAFGQDATIEMVKNLKGK